MKARRKWFSKKTNKQQQQQQKNKNKEKTLNSRDNYLCVIITLSPKERKNLKGKLNEKKMED